MNRNTERICIRGVYFDKVTMQSAFAAAKDLISSEGFDYVFTPNSEIVQNCIEDNALYEIINSASLIIPDGIGVIYASKILGRPLPEKVAGFDLSKRILSYAAETKKRVFLLGSAPATNETRAVCDIAAEKISQLFPGIVISGTHDGYFSESESDNIVEEINASGADILLVCLGAPKQEKWIYSNREKLNVSFAMGLGGSLDVYAGTVKRAPDIFIKMNLEWFYRLIKQPYRIGRMMKLPKLLFGAVIYKLSRRDRKFSE